MSDNTTAHRPDVLEAARELVGRWQAASDRYNRMHGGYPEGTADHMARAETYEACADQLAEAITAAVQQCPAGSPQTDHGASIAACAQQDRYPLLYALIQSGADVCAAIEAVLTERTT